FLVFLSLTSCTLNPTGIQLNPAWTSHSLSAWHNHHPDMMVVSQDKQWLYVSCETNASLLAPSLLAIHIETGKQHILLFGLHKADGLKVAPDGSLWLGEEFKDGLFWRITEPATLPSEQRVDRATLASSTPAIMPLHRVGNFKHEGLAFSKDGQFAYMADEWKEGCIYRYNLHTHQLKVLHKDKGWLLIRDAKHARMDAEKLHGQYFNRIEDMETLPNGQILLAETKTGRILKLDDRSTLPKVSTWLENNALIHPDNLAWDDKRHWLWITDDDDPSYLWAWDGHTLREIAHHDSAEITGVTLHGSDVYINLQQNLGQPDVLLRLREKAHVNDL
ncbi:MAG: hypothetical protein Q9M18_09385, partial [Mariprofundaceae bacterium]|nr:hypothetical protein [Mariprofundaceae bacterium]